MKYDDFLKTKQKHIIESGLTIFSLPFAGIYTYSSHVEDMGNSTNYN